MRLPRFPALLLALSAVSLLAGAAAAAEFTPAQRAEIVQIMRDALKQDPTILRDAITSMQTQETVATLDAHRGELVNAGDPEAGNPHGDVTIVEFFDTRCPYCRRLEPAMEQFLAQDHGVKLVFKDLPILGPQSVLGSKALLAAQKQGGYEKLREAVMQMPPDTTLPMIQAAAAKLGLNWDKLSHDMDDASVEQRIKNNLNLAHALAIEGTPALVVGDQIVPGAVGVDDLQKLVADARRARH